MILNLKSVAAIGAFVLLTTGTAQAQLNDGTDGSNSTSVFISVVERDGSNNALRNLIVDTGVSAADLSNSATPWSTTANQEADILTFINSSTGTVTFNVGAALTDQTFATDLYAIITSGASAGPGIADFSALGSGVTKTQNQISNANFGTFSADGVLAANLPTDFGFHEFSWGNDIDGSISASNEILFGDASQIQQWRYNDVSFQIENAVLGALTSDASTGDITFGAAVVPVPAAAWLFGSALGLLGWIRRRQAS